MSCVMKTESLCYFLIFFSSPLFIYFLLKFKFFRIQHAKTVCKAFERIVLLKIMQKYAENNFIYTF